MQAFIPSATLVTFAVYLIVLLAIGAIGYRATRNLADYMLGGRRLGPGVAALSAGASDMSGWLLLGLPGAIYASGLNQVWIAIGLTVGAYLNWQFVAKRLRVYTFTANDAITVPDFLQKRFEDQRQALGVVASLIILLFFAFYTSAGMVAGAKLFEATFGFDYHTALWIGGGIIVAYTFLGGFLAVSWTDFLQGLLMFAALLIVPIIAFQALGGWQPTVTAIDRIDPSYNELFHDMSLFAIISLAAWGLGYFGQPHIIVRFMALRDAAEVPRARLIGMSWMILSLLGAVLVGYVGIAYFADSPLEDAEKVFIALVTALTHPWIAGILLAAILAAVMSTIDSQLLVASSALTEDIYKAFLRPRASETELLWVGRLAVVAIAVIALLIASDPQAQVLGLVAYAWGGFGAAFGPVILFSLFWRRMTGTGALAGIIVGALTVVIWKQLAGGIFEMYEILPGFILASVAIVGVSLLGQPTARMTATFDQAAANWR